MKKQTLYLRAGKGWVPMRPLPPKKSAWVVMSDQRVRVGSFAFCFFFAWIWSFGTVDVRLDFREDLNNWILKGV